MKYAYLKTFPTREAALEAATEEVTPAYSRLRQGWVNAPDPVVGINRLARAFAKVGENARRAGQSVSSSGS